MRVHVSAISRFHSFDLARELCLRGNLGTLYTSYPSFKVDVELRSRVRSNPLPIAVNRLGNAVVAAYRVSQDLKWWANNAFDKWVAKRLEPADLLVGLSGMCLETMRAARRLGMKCVCDRGSTHIRHQAHILAEEFDRWGLSPHPIEERIVEREEKEYAFADAVTVPSSHVYSTFIEHGIAPSKLHVLPYGVDLSLFSPGPKPDDVFRVLFVGTASLRKGIPYLIEAVKGLQHLRNFEVWLVGGQSPDAEPFLRNLPPHVINRGFVARTDLPAVYRAGSVLVLPSIEEGFGLVQLQAMASGLPVIATQNTGAVDLLAESQAGFIVPIRSSEHVRNAILRLYDDSELLDAMSRSALECVRQNEGWSRYGTAACDAYERICVV